MLLSYNKQCFLEFLLPWTVLCIINKLYIPYTYTLYTNMAICIYSLWYSPPLLNSYICTIQMKKNKLIRNGNSNNIYFSCSRAEVYKKKKYPQHFYSGGFLFIA